VSLADLTPRTRAELRGARGPEGIQGPRGPQGAQGPRGAEGQPGANGADGSAIAFAHITADGDIDEANTKGVNSVAAPFAGEGVYCFDLVPTARNAVASIDFTTTNSFPPNASQDAVYPVLPGVVGTQGSVFIAAFCPAAQQDALVVISNQDQSGAITLPQRGFWINFN
jgi:hypothetical protein